MDLTSRTVDPVSDMRDHWAVWRPEWTPDRACLYWYLVFRGDDAAAALGDAVLRTVEGVDWLDTIPPPWLHVTLADIGFADELGQAQLDDVVAAVRDALAGEARLPLRFGPVRAWTTAIVLDAEPVDRLRAIRSAARRAAATALTPGRPERPGTLYRPHLSVGYVNRTVDAGTVSSLLDRLPEVDVRLDVEAVTLAAVTRRDHHYQWEVRDEVPLTAAGG